ncbi:MAG: DUF5916 domain-containing protein [Cyclobacteriaceae bacterium]
MVTLQFKLTQLITRGLLLLLSIFCSATVSAQLPGLHIQRAISPITIDGVMDEEAWKDAEVADHFKQLFPFDSSYAKVPTEVRVTYDDRFIYVFAIMYNSGPRKYVTPSLKRDYRGPGIDGLSMVFDTYKDRTNGFLFGINPYGVQREGLIANGGSNGDDLNLSWDNKWYSEAKILEDRWVCEVAIPFKTIRFKEGLDSWHVNFYRIDSYYNEQSTWSPISRVYSPTTLAFNRDLLWDKPLGHPGGNISIIPYLAAKNTDNFEKKLPTDQSIAFGGDAKIGLGPALNLDITVNPDFSQVEVDQQVTNLSRFEISYPEKRQFFLENADLFSSFGYGNMRPFFSRRIGLQDTSKNSNNKNKLIPIYAGLRLSGKINNNWRVGLLTMQAAKDESINLPSTNYTVAAIQRKVFARSNIGLMLINKQADFNLSPTNYNRLIGIDYNLASKNNKWNGKAFYHRSFTQDKKDSAYAATVAFVYSVPKLEIDLTMQTVGANYDPQVGYVPRTRFNRIAPELYYSWYPKSKIINNHGPGFDVDVIGNDIYGVTDWDANIWYKMAFQNTSNFFMRVRRDYVYLFNAFDPSNSNGLKLPKGSDYYYNSIIMSYQSNTRKRFFFSAQTRSGEYFNGHRINLDGNISYRIQPHAVLSVDFSLNRINLPSPYASTDLALVSPKFDFTFSRKLFWTTFVQFNSQNTNLNINSRLQWRFKPVSDFFLVYTDNYFAEAGRDGNILYLGQPKLRAIVLKFTYWLNL